MQTATPSRRPIADFPEPGNPTSAIVVDAPTALGMLTLHQRAALRSVLNRLDALGLTPVALTRLPVATTEP